MLIGLVTIDAYQTSTVLGDGGTPGTPPSFAIFIRVSASDGPNLVGQVLDVRIPATANKSEFNDLLAQAAINYINSQNGWTIDPKHLFLQTFDRA